MANRYLIAALALAAGLGACHKSYDTDTDNPAPAYKASAGDSRKVYPSFGSPVTAPACQWRTPCSFSLRTTPA